jgi:hypothetical protein
MFSCLSLKSSVSYRSTKRDLVLSSSFRRLIWSQASAISCDAVGDSGFSKARSMVSLIHLDKDTPALLAASCQRLKASSDATYKRNGRSLIGQLLCCSSINNCYQI